LTVRELSPKGEFRSIHSATSEGVFISPLAISTAVRGSEQY